MRRYILLICLVLFGLIGAFSVDAQDPHSRLVITPDNADQVTQLPRLGRGAVNSLVWSPDASLLAIGTTHGAWLTNSTMSDAPKQLLTRSPVGYFVFSSDSRFLAAGTTEGPTWVWEIDADGVAHDLTCSTRNRLFRSHSAQMDGF
jgi:hypothetical protein